MTPYDQARLLYHREPCARPFEHDLLAHLRTGYVYSNPQGFVLARPVWSKAPQEMIVDPCVLFPVEQCDAWLIYLYAGDLAALLDLFPFTLPLIGWEKRNKLRFHPFEETVARLKTCGTIRNG